jgi:hypothetical protein
MIHVQQWHGRFRAGNKKSYVLTFFAEGMVTHLCRRYRHSLHRSNIREMLSRNTSVTGKGDTNNYTCVTVMRESMFHKL